MDGIASQSKNVTQITVELSNALTPEVFSLIVEKTISYISYGMNQLPVNFDILRALMKRRRARMTELAASEEFSELYRELECGGRYNSIEQIYDVYEATFLNIHKQLVNDRGVREIVIVVGLPLMPKQVYVIVVPKLTRSHPTPLMNARRSLCQLFMTLVQAMTFPSLERNMLETFVYLGSDNPSSFSSDWFTPKRFFLHRNTPVTTIQFDIDDLASGLLDFKIHEDVSVSDETDGPSAEPESEVIQESLPSTIFQASGDLWFGGKLGLKGFREGRMNGELLLGRLQRLLNR